MNVNAVTYWVFWWYYHLSGVTPPVVLHIAKTHAGLSH